MMAEHRDAYLIQQYFAQTGFPEMAQLMEAVRHGVPVDVDGGGDLLASIQYGNHSSAHTHTMSFGNGWWRTLRGDES